MTRWLRPLPPTSTVVDGDYVSADSHLGFGVSRQPRDTPIACRWPRTARPGKPVRPTQIWLCIGGAAILHAAASAPLSARPTFPAEPGRAMAFVCW